MRKNIGEIDMFIRIVIGTLLIATALTGFFAPWGWFGIVPLMTGVIGWCPAYAIFGVRSSSLQSEK